MEKQKKEKRIYPYLIEKSRMQGYYEVLLDEGFKLKYFNKKKDKEVYDFFLPTIREYMFWTFDLIVCQGYSCNIFQKGQTIVVCFSTGICFVITENKKIANDLKEYRERKQMRNINLREDESYDILAVSKEENESYIYLYVLELYKMIYLEIIAKEIQNSEKFDKAREEFVEFTTKVFNVKITDNKEGYELAEKIEKTLELDKQYIKVDDEFDLIYKNNKLNDKEFNKKFLIAVLVVLLILGLLNFASKIDLIKTIF